MLISIQTHCIPQKEPLLKVSCIKFHWFDFIRIRIHSFELNDYMSLNKYEAWALADNILHRHLGGPHAQLHHIVDSCNAININKATDAKQTIALHTSPETSIPKIHYAKQNYKRMFAIPHQYALDLIETIYSFLGPSDTTIALCNQEHVQARTKNRWLSIHKKTNINM